MRESWQVLELLFRHRGKIIGAIVGVVLSWMVLVFGVAHLVCHRLHGRRHICRSTYRRRQKHGMAAKKLRGENLSNRRLAREVALRALFQVDVGQGHPEEALAYNIQELGVSGTGS